MSSAKWRSSPFGRDELRSIIEASLRDINLYSEGLTVLLMGTAAVESGYGIYNKQENGGPARGIFQMEPATHDDIWECYLKYRPDLAEAVTAILPTGMTKHKALEDNLGYQIAMAGILYHWRTKSFPSTSDIAGLAAAWKKYWNTSAGKGTEAKFIENFNRYCVAAR